MQIFLDSVNVAEILEAKLWGMLDGITTNPTLFAKADSSNFDSVAISIARSAPNLPISIEAVSTDYDSMIKEGEKILHIADNIVLKLPITLEGIRACRHFTNLGRMVNMTLCFTLTQAIIAAKAGATYVSPFIGRIDDMQHKGIELVKNIVHVYKHYGYKTKVLSSSTRTLSHISEAALVGSDAVTMPFTLLKSLLHHPLTSQGVETFTHDWNNIGMSILDHE